MAIPARSRCCWLQDPVLKAKVALDPTDGQEVPMRAPFSQETVDRFKEAIGYYERAGARVLATEVRRQAART